MRALGRLWNESDLELLTGALTHAYTNRKIAAAAAQGLQALGSLGRWPRCRRQHGASSRRSVSTLAFGEPLLSALDACAVTPDERTLLIDALEAPGLRGVAARILARTPHPAAPPQLRALLTDQSPKTRRAALVALAAHGFPDGLLDAVISAETSDNLAALAAVRHAPAVEDIHAQVVTLLAAHPVPDVRSAALRTAARIDGQLAVRLLPALLADPSVRVREDAAAVAAELHHDHMATSGIAPTLPPAIVEVADACHAAIEAQRPVAPATEYITVASAALGDTAKMLDGSRVVAVRRRLIEAAVACVLAAEAVAGGQTTE
ncbi:MAG: hypothetical protein GEU74_01030 [Nitriliruptorales bacterium]|nr:hypothetical protein [Nitriliruptorales bacterium]